MIPNFHDNDLIICLKHFYSLKEGDVILIKTPALGVIIKRIKNIKEKIKVINIKRSKALLYLQ